MQEVTQYPSGTFCWVELATTDAAAAKQFYTSLFGWQANDIPIGPDMVYTMLLLEGKDVAALHTMGAEQQAQGFPPHWASYISVDDVVATAERAASLGANILMPPTVSMEYGHMAMVQDPTGAIFGLWQPNQMIGAKLVNIPGTLCWNELDTRDAARASDFYTGVFGWEAKTTTDGPMPYTSYINQGRMAAGMMQMTAEWGDIPPHWAVYFAVENCDASVEKAQALGGSVITPPTDIPNTGRFAVLQDPQGAVFMVIKMDAFDPPPGYEK